MAGNPYKKYGLTIEGYNRLSEAQNGLCRICSQPPLPGNRLYVDHDHKTGAVRGLLCAHCNSGIGFFRDNTDWLQSAITYLNTTGVPLPPPQAKPGTGFDVTEFLVVNKGRIKGFALDEQGQVKDVSFFPENVAAPEQTFPELEPKQLKDLVQNDDLPDAVDLAFNPPKGMAHPVPDYTGESN